MPACRIAFQLVDLESRPYDALVLRSTCDIRSIIQTTSSADSSSPRLFQPSPRWSSAQDDARPGERHILSATVSGSIAVPCHRRRYAPAPSANIDGETDAFAEVSARFCADPVPGLTCCLSCPLSYWVFDDNFDHQAASANWVGVVGFILNSLMLLTYILCPEEKSHRHYLSVGLTVSLLLLGLTFVVPLSTKPNQCYDEITPNNMRSDLSCAWSGALLLAGAMGAVTWSM